MKWYQEKGVLIDRKLQSEPERLAYHKAGELIQVLAGQGIPSLCYWEHPDDGVGALESGLIELRFLNPDTTSPCPHCWEKDDGTEEGQ